MDMGINVGISMYTFPYLLLIKNVCEVRRLLIQGINVSLKGSP